MLWLQPLSHAQPLGVKQTLDCILFSTISIALVHVNESSRGLNDLKLILTQPFLLIKSQALVTVPPWWPTAQLRVYVFALAHPAGPFHLVLTVTIAVRKAMTLYTDVLLEELPDSAGALPPPSLTF